MSERPIELCIECDQPTGRAGAAEDSLIWRGGAYCEECFEGKPEPCLCPAEFRSPLCGYTGDDATCGKTFEDCRRKGNEVRFCGTPLIPQPEGGSPPPSDSAVEEALGMFSVEGQEGYCTCCAQTGRHAEGCEAAIICAHIAAQREEIADANLCSACRCVGMDECPACEAYKWHTRADALKALLKIAACPDTACSGGMISRVRDADTYWTAERCQFCGERERLLK